MLRKKPNILTRGLTSVGVSYVDPNRRTPTNSDAAMRANLGAQPMDQIFVSEHHGYFNAGKMLRMFMSRPGNMGLLELPMDPSLIDYIKEFVEVDQPLIDNMSIARRDEPILGVELADANPLLIIDGHHRIMRRHQDGLKTVQVLIMPNKKLHMIHTPHAAIPKQKARR